MCELLYSSYDASQETDMLQKYKATALGLTTHPFGDDKPVLQKGKQKASTGPNGSHYLKFSISNFLFLLNLHKTEPRPKLYLNLVL